MICLAPPSRSEVRKEPSAGMKTSRQPATTPGIESGSVTLRKRARARPQHLGGLQQRQVQLFQRRVDRQDHERQEAVHQPDHDREWGVEDRQRLVDQPQLEQPGVDEPGIPHEEDHGEGAHQEAGPERQHHQEQQEVSPAATPRDDVGHRIAQHEADDGARDRPDEGPLQDLQIERVEEPRVVLQGESRLHPAVDPARHEAVHQHDEDRDQEERQQPEPARRQQGPRPCLRPGVQPGEGALPEGGHYSSSRIWQSSGSQATAAASPRFHASGLMSWPSFRTATVTSPAPGTVTITCIVSPR